MAADKRERYGMLLVDAADLFRSDVLKKKEMLSVRPSVLCIQATHARVIDCELG